jgi:hypothetical protein
MTGELTGQRTTEPSAAPAKYRRCLVMAGGGGRLGIHLGTYAAACEAGLAPDVVLGTCGGALIAAIVHAESDLARQLDLLAGPEMYRFWCSARPRAHGSATAALRAVLRRAADLRHAPRVPDLDGDALFEIAGPLPDLQWRTDGAGPDALVLGARLLHAPGDVGKPRAKRALLQPVAIGSARAGALLAGAPTATAHGHHAGSAVAPLMEAVDTSALSLQQAVQISLTDMVYLPAAEAAGARWLGGVVDLLPVELAARLADEVWIDHKDRIPRWTMQPAWREVLGIDGWKRQQQVDRTPVALRIDHRDLGRTLREQVLHRELRFAQGRWLLQLRACASEADYRRVMQAQFDEGRRRAQAALAAQR